MAKIIIVGVLCLIPLLGGAMIGVVATFGIDGKSNPLLFQVLMIGGMLGLVPLIPLWLLLLSDASRNPRLSGSSKVLWCLGMTVFSIVALPMYWYRELWIPRSEPSPSASTEMQPRT